MEEKRRFVVAYPFDCEGAVPRAKNDETVLSQRISVD